jgi:hypothetical protein
VTDLAHARKRGRLAGRLGGVVATPPRSPLRCAFGHGRGSAASSFTFTRTWMPDPARAVDSEIVSTLYPPETAANDSC